MLTNTIQMLLLVSKLKLWYIYLTCLCVLQSQINPHSADAASKDAAMITDIQLAFARLKNLLLFLQKSESNIGYCQRVITLRINGLNKLKGK